MMKYIGNVCKMVQGADIKYLSIHHGFLSLVVYHVTIYKPFATVSKVILSFFVTSAMQQNPSPKSEYCISL